MPRPHRHPARQSLRTSSGAFDLPSIITGVVVVGILTAGVLAAIFGVIPWAQDRSAKQDLAAINTAQGVTYAKDGQVYKDLAGINDAKLVSGLDPAKTTVKTGKAGKAYTASIMSSSGKKWCISNENTDPWECTEAPPGTAAPGDWSGAFCEPELKLVMDASMGMYLDPGVLEYLKAQTGMAYDEAAVAVWVDKYMHGGYPLDPDALDPELVATADDMSRVVQEALFRGIDSLPSANVEEWPAIHAKAVDAYNAAGADFCSTYTGPVAELKEHPSRAEAFEDQRQALTGSHEPVVFGFTFDFGSKDTFDIEVSGAEGLAGFKSASQGFEMVDGKPYWTVTLSPGSSGWGESAATAEMTLTSTRSDDAKKLKAKEMTWKMKANSNVLKFQDPPLYPAIEAPGYGDTWDHLVRHKGSVDTYLSYAVAQLGSSAGGSLSFHPVEILDMTEGMNARVSEWSHGLLDDGSTRRDFSFYTADGETLNEGTLTLRQTVFNPQTFARASHDFSYSVIKPVSNGGPAVTLSDVSQTVDSSTVVTTLAFDVADGYFWRDYSYEVLYAGETVSIDDYAEFMVTPEIRAIMTVYPYDFIGIGGNPHAVVYFEFYGNQPQNKYPKEFELKATYLLTGESTTIPVTLP